MKIMLVSAQALLCDGLSEFFCENRGPALEVMTAPAWSSGIARVARDPSLAAVLVDLDLPGLDLAEAIDELQLVRPELPLVAIGSSTDREFIAAALAAGAAGYVPKRSPATVLMAAIDLACTGSTYVPPEILGPEETLRGAKRLPDPRREGAASAAADLTHRQADVLNLLAQGKSNKQISGELGIALGTVKIHVTALLRALNVSNRTQAVSVMFAAAGGVNAFRDGGPGRAGGYLI